MGDLSFLKTAVKDYKVGAVTRTSKYVVKKILSYVKPEYRYFVEYGPGDGAVTKELLKGLPDDAKYIAIELNEDFYKKLKEIDDDRLTVINGDIVEYSKKLKELGIPRVDFVLSSIPFSFLSPKVRHEVIENTHEALEKGGTFLMFQYSFLMRPIFKKVFKKVKSFIEFRNLPPYCIIIAEKD